MKHLASAKFWLAYDDLSESVQRSADRAFSLLRNDPSHPSLRFKRVGRFWSARVDLNHRALAIRPGDDFVWLWIGSHADYQRLLR